MAFVYMLTNKRGNVLYVGSTVDLVIRLRLHKERKLPGFTRDYNVTKLVYFERCNGFVEARIREYQIKGKTRAKKNAIVESINPNWEELTFPERSEGPQRRAELAVDTSAQIGEILRYAQETMEFLFFRKQCLFS